MRSRADDGNLIVSLWGSRLLEHPMTPHAVVRRPCSSGVPRCLHRAALPCHAPSPVAQKDADM
eukprot:366341-Chlamydomonas_euryale.AAC.25